MNYLDQFNICEYFHPFEKVSDEWIVETNRFVIWCPELINEKVIEFANPKELYTDCYEIKCDVDNLDNLQLWILMINIKRAIPIFRHKDDPKELLYVHPGILHFTERGMQREYIIPENENIQDHIPSDDPKRKNHFFVIFEGYQNYIC